ncbi:flavin reductase family protein [Dactylosporangium sp. NPDC051484]|uniref:flavin reductase family protein n=1 Tax=Dactylosporangium sp. NPDC051484 TaxID=3154942 RepID=UPI0034502B48
MSPRGRGDVRGVSPLTEQSDSARLRQVFGAFPSGVIAIAACVDGLPLGISVSSYTSVSLEPPLVSVCIAHSSETWPLIREARRLGVSMLADDQQQACRQLSSRGRDRFAGLTWRATPDGAVFLDGAIAWLDCSIEATHVAGDHDIVVMRVHELDADHAIRPLVFHTSKFWRLVP